MQGVVHLSNRCTRAGSLAWSRTHRSLRYHGCRLSTIAGAGSKAEQQLAWVAPENRQTVQRLLEVAERAAQVREGRSLRPLTRLHTAVRQATGCTDATMCTNWSPWPAAMGPHLHRLPVTAGGRGCHGLLARPSRCGLHPLGRLPPGACRSYSAPVAVCTHFMCLGCCVGCSTAAQHATSSCHEMNLIHFLWHLN